MTDTPNPAPSPTPAPAPAPAPTPAPAWYGTDPETKGYLENRGWHDKKPEEVALNAIKAHREAERLIGAPASELIRLPKDAKDEAAHNALWARLGAPADPKEYDLSPVKDEKLAISLREVAAQIHLPKDKALEIAKAISKHQEVVDAAKATEQTQKLTLEKTELKKNWGVNETVNKLAAEDGARRLGVTPVEVSALENVVGYARVMEMFRKVGSGTAEDTFAGGDTGGVGGKVLSKDAAVARKAELMRDKAWSDSYLNGDAEKNREMQRLIAIIAG